MYRKICYRLLHWFLCGLVTCSAAYAHAATPFDTARLGTEGVSLTPYFDILQDTQGALTLHDVRAGRASQNFIASENQSAALNFGFSNSVYWLRLRLENSGSTAMRTMLEISFPHIGKLDLHYPDAPEGRTEVQTGNSRPFDARAYKNHFFVFPLTVAPASSPYIYMRIESPDVLEVPAKLWSRPAFYAHERTDHIIQSWYFGMVVALILFNVLQFIFIRNINYLLYVAFAAGIAISTAANNGLASEFLWPDSPYWAQISTVIFVSITYTVLLVFIRKMFHTAEIIPRFDKVLKLFIALHLSIPVLVGISFHTFLAPALVSHAVTALVVYGCGIYCAWLRQRSAYFFVASFSVICAGMVLYTLRTLDILPSNFITTQGAQFGSAIALLVLSFILVDSFYIARREKTKALKESFSTQQLIVEKLKISEQVLEDRVADRTRELSESNKMLAATHQNMSVAFQSAEAARIHAETAQKLADDKLLELRSAQTSLIQSEKMAALGQLVTGVAHEINTPIGAIKSSSTQIVDNIHYALRKLSLLAPTLQTSDMLLLKGVLMQALQTSEHLSSREERAIARTVTQQLQEMGVENPRQKAALLMQLHAHSDPVGVLPLLVGVHSDVMLQAAKDIASLINNANNIQTAVERVSRIVFSLTSFEQDDAPTALVATDLIGNIESAIALYQSRIQQGTQLVRHYTPLPELPCLPEKLAQVWSNLIFNALQAMQFEGTLTIDVSMQKNHAVVVFNDTGCGMSESLHNDIFKPFFTTKPAGEGSGLGLFTALKIIEKHHGTLHVHSVAHHGATFTVRLPYPESSTPTGTEVPA